MRKHYKPIPNLTIPESEQFAIAQPTHPKFNYSGVGTVCDRTINHLEFNYSGVGTVCDRAIKPIQIQLFRSWNSLRKHHKPIPNLTIPKLEQFA
ncbi:hypothetical protein [Brunnivagina elsteri]|uniref:Uncharacterized protein n=1 Tax=Brunnivagina elsteri CCALA 953 TaxID=987040 RepID=A0A2A2TPD3_9CYAN|nr:hypothetical protein [Calothrix elsteri]PAX60292.1 hypothetical protein CK510_02620 [Calothrix elsteri CCALA 953]